MPPDGRKVDVYLEVGDRNSAPAHGATPRELATAAATTQGRITRSEVKFISTVSVAAIQKKADDLAKQYRELDTRIQEADWLTVLLD